MQLFIYGIWFVSILRNLSLSFPAINFLFLCLLICGLVFQSLLSSAVLLVCCYVSYQEPCIGESTGKFLSYFKSCLNCCLCFQFEAELETSYHSWMGFFCWFCFSDILFFFGSYFSLILLTFFFLAKSILWFVIFPFAFTLHNEQVLVVYTKSM